MGRFRKQNGLCEIVLCKQCMMMTMQCTNSTRFSSSGFAGCHNSTPLTMDLALEIRLMVPEGWSAICVFSLRVDPRDTTNKRSLSVIVERILREQKVEVEVSQIKPPLTSMERGNRCILIHFDVQK